jgi:outer membrane protein insertion porin family
MAIIGGLSVPRPSVAVTGGSGTNELPSLDQIQLSQAAPAGELLGRKIQEITVQGSVRIEKEAVLAKLSSKPGVVLTADLLRQDIQTVFALGYFDEVEFLGVPTASGVNLTIQVVERPAISKVSFEGNEKISSEDLNEVVKLKAWSILDVNKVREDLGLIQKHYEEKGFYLTKVSHEVKPIEGKSDQVELVYKIRDFEKVQIRKITFLNNKRFSDEQLKAILMETKEGGAFSALGSSASFKESAFKQDLQRLTYWYLEHGYVKFRYENPVVTVSEDKKSVFISLYLDEGEEYKVGSVDFGGDLLFGRDELSRDLTLKSEEVFSISKRNTDIQHLSEMYEDKGFAFANVIPRMQIKDESRTVDIQYDFEKGSLVYFGEISIVGNSKTHDKVIRRELKIREGELYSGTKLRQSRENVERLGYFAPGEVIFNKVSVKDRPDLVNIEISIKERSTGTITLGAGYGDFQGFFFSAQISEQNFLGKGQSLSLTGQYAADQLSRSLSLGYTDPFIFDTRWTAGADFFYVLFPIPDKYLTRKTGINFRFGYPIAEYTNAYVTYKLENLIIEEDANALLSLDPVDKEADSGLLSSVVWSVVRDKRNNRFETTGGNFQSASLETSGFGGDKSFVKLVLNNRYYTKLVGDLVLRNSTELGNIFALAGDTVPPAERFYLGGANNLKGFTLFSVGPRKDPRADKNGRLVEEPEGGKVEAFTLVELEYPLIREAGLKFVLFFDAGNAYRDWDEARGLEMRADAGFGFRWFSPIGPLRFEWGYPLDRKPGENNVNFVFFIGPPF